MGFVKLPNFDNSEVIFLAVWRERSGDSAATYYFGKTLKCCSVVTNGFSLLIFRPSCSADINASKKKNEIKGLRNNKMPYGLI